MTNTRKMETSDLERAHAVEAKLIDSWSEFNSMFLDFEKKYGSGVWPFLDEALYHTRNAANLFGESIHAMWEDGIQITEKD